MIELINLRLVTLVSLLATCVASDSLRGDDAVGVGMAKRSKASDKHSRARVERELVKRAFK